MTRQALSALMPKIPSKAWLDYSHLNIIGWSRVLSLPTESRAIPLPGRAKAFDTPASSSPLTGDGEVCRIPAGAFAVAHVTTCVTSPLACLRGQWTWPPCRLTKGSYPVWFCRLRCHVVVKMGPTSFGEDHSKKSRTDFYYHVAVCLTQKESSPSPCI